jgi:4'-phosphopantetheinyl transferase
MVTLGTMGSCQVCWARTTAAGRLLPLLPDADLQRADAFCLQADRDRSVVAAGLVRLLLAARLGVGPAELVIDRNAGKPRLSWPAASLDFSVSHAGDQVVVAISDGPAVGVDVERLGRIDPDATRAWVRDEAAFKAGASGTGTCTVIDLAAAPGYLAALAMLDRTGPAPPSAC